MTEPRKPNLSQRVSGGAQQTGARRQKTATRPAPPLASSSSAPSATAEDAQHERKTIHLYFSLEIVDEVDAEADDPFTTLDADPDFRPKARTLEVNKNYLLRVRAGSNRMDRTEGGASHPINHDSELLVGVFGGDYDGINLPKRRCSLAYDSADGFSYDFEIHLAPDCKGRLVTLGALMKNAGGEWELVATLAVNLDGPLQPSANLLQTAGVDPDFRYPDYVGTLYFQELNADYFKATCYNERSVPPLLTVEFPKPAFAQNAESVADDADLEESVDHFFNYANRDRALNEIRQWLASLPRHKDSENEDQVVVIITDLTDSNLPWELLELRQDQYLGAVAQVTRQLPTQPRAPHYQDMYHRGAGLAFVASERTHAAQNRNALRGVDVQLFVAFDAFKEHLLEVGVDGAALVYLDSDDAFTYPPRRRGAAGQDAPEARPANGPMTVFNLERVRISGGGRPLFVASARHSAILLRDASGLLGYPEVLLRRCAGGYIGTLGPVNADVANDLCEHLVNAIRIHDRGFHAAEFLRRWRAKAAKAYSDPKPSPPEIRRRIRRAFMCAFTYVYYGDPLARWNVQNQSHVDSQSGVDS